MATVRCKFRLNTVTRKMGNTYLPPTEEQKAKGERGVYVPCEQYDASFTAVYSEDPLSENKRFWDSTPSGEFKVTTIKDMPWELGKEYYLDITEAP